MKFQKSLFVSFCILFSVFTTSAQKITEIPTVSVSGTAEIKVVPDSVVFRLSVEKINMKVIVAKKENDESVSQILGVAKKFGIQNKDVKTDFISVSKRYEWIGTGANRRKNFKGYAVSKTVIIKLKDLTKFEAFFSDILTTGVSEVRGVHFQTSEFQKHRKEMRIKAMKVAKEKAREMAQAIDQTIGRALKISENNSRRFANANITANYLGVVGNSRTTTGTFSPGTITIKSQVTVQFLLK